MKYYILKINGSSVSFSYATTGCEIVCSMESEDGSNLFAFDDGDHILVYRDEPISTCTMSLIAKGENKFIKELEVANGANINSFSDEIKSKIHNQNGILVEITEKEYNEIFLEMINSISVSKKVKTPSLDYPLQKIYFGAPGTGKSHEINMLCAEHENYRTTFHPDTDYASFVGSYKPITELVPRYTYMGAQAIAVKDEEGKPIIDTKNFLSLCVSVFSKGVCCRVERANERSA